MALQQIILPPMPENAQGGSGSAPWGDIWVGTINPLYTQAGWKFGGDKSIRTVAYVRYEIGTIPTDVEITKVAFRIVHEGSSVEPTPGFTRVGFIQPDGIWDVVGGFQDIVTHGPPGYDAYRDYPYPTDPTDVLDDTILPDILVGDAFVGTFEWEIADFGAFRNLTFWGDDDYSPDVPWQAGGNPLAVALKDQIDNVGNPGYATGSQCVVVFDAFQAPGAPDEELFFGLRRHRAGEGGRPDEAGTYLFVTYEDGIAVGVPPIITSDPGSAVGHLGEPYLHTVVAIDPDEAGPIEYTLTAPPDGAIINLSSGIITWTPGTTGDHVFQVVVTDVEAETDTQTWTVTVLPERGLRIVGTETEAAVVSTHSTSRAVQSTGVEAEPSVERVGFGAEPAVKSTGVAVDSAVVATTEVEES